ncbi:hypothetical protein FFF34_016020 [Inquilinus sp. KBS0705]|nr:hypothetical protein FFF34_016020 [Inquilinus sp. KBS0705]
MTKRKKLRIFWTVCIFLLVTCSSLKLYAQCDPFIDPNCEDPDLETPLDQWVVGFVVLAGVYGVKKLNIKEI